MRGLGLGRVVESESPSYEVGQLVQGLIGWQEWMIASDATPLQPVPDIPGVSPSAFLGVLGMTGLTAWVGIRDIGRPQPGETVVVSAAAGAVGSVAGQIAKLDGARVVGIAGGPEKCAILTERLGFDAAVDYKAPGWRDQLIAATPERIDVDFESVGGEIMDAVFARLNLRARVALCGLISGYNDSEPPPGPRSFGNLLVQRALVQGFIVLDHFDRLAETAAELSGWIAEGKLEPSRRSSRASSSCRRRSTCSSTVPTPASWRRPSERRLSCVGFWIDIQNLPAQAWLAAELVCSYSLGRGGIRVPSWLVRPSGDAGAAQNRCSRRHPSDGPQEPEPMATAVVLTALYREWRLWPSARRLAARPSPGERPLQREA